MLSVGLDVEGITSTRGNAILVGFRKMCWLKLHSRDLSNLHHSEGAAWLFRDSLAANRGHHTPHEYSKPSCRCGSGLQGKMITAGH